MDLLTEAIATRLEELGLSAGKIAESDERQGGDLIVEVPAHPEPLLASVDIRRRTQPLGPSEALQWRAGRPRFTVLALPTIPSGIARQYRGLGINYVDSGGNAYLHYPGFHVHVEGRRPAAAESLGLEPPASSLNPAGLRVVFALLVEPELTAIPYEQLAGLSNVSKGSVTSTMADLRRRGHIFGNASARQLTDRPRLARNWVDGYIRDLRPRLKQLSLHGPEPEWWARHWRSPQSGVLGGGLALAHLGGSLAPDRTILYGEDPWTAARQAGRLSREGSGANVTLRERFWSPLLRPSDRFVAPMLAYADALADGDPRDVEVARALAQEQSWEFAQ